MYPSSISDKPFNPFSINILRSEVFQILNTVSYFDIQI